MANLRNIESGDVPADFEPASDEHCDCCGAPDGWPCDCDLDYHSGCDAESGYWGGLYCSTHEVLV